jgi:hypothetical protein
MKSFVLMAGMACATSAYAQTCDQVLKPMSGITAQEALLVQSVANLSEMLSTLHGRDNDGVEIAAEEGNYLRARLSAVDSLGALICVMQTNADRSQLVGMLRGDAAATIHAAEGNIKTINKALGLMKRPAAVAEVTKLRDAAIALTGLLRHLLTVD